MKKLLTLLFILAFSSISFSQVVWSGDARVRPRLDIKDNGNYGGKTTDYYYMLRARLNMKATIGDGWYFKTQLAHYGYGLYSFSSGLSTEPPLGGMIEGSRRPSLSFMQLYIAVNKKSWGIEGGLIPINSVANPLWDVHYYPNKMIDVPYFVYSLLGGMGFHAFFKVGEGTLGLYAMNDKNGHTEDDINGNSVYDVQDAYTYVANYTYKAKSGLMIQPQVFLSTSSDSIEAPVTFGINLAAPKVGGFNIHGSFGYTNQSKTGTLEYNGYLARLGITGKLGPGTLILWYDLAKRTDKFTAGDIETNFGYLWLKYKITVYKGKHGEFSIAPTIRRLSETIDNVKDFSRYKLEITTEVKFK